MVMGTLLGPEEITTHGVAPWRGARGGFLLEQIKIARHGLGDIPQMWARGWAGVWLVLPWGLWVLTE